MTHKTLLDTMTEGVTTINPELLRAPEAKRRMKAKRSFVAVALGLFSVVVFLGGCALTFMFAKAAIAGNQKVDTWLLASLLIPLVPGAILMFYAAAKLDPDAGTIFEQMSNFVGSAVKKWRGA